MVECAAPALCACTRKGKRAGHSALLACSSSSRPAGCRRQRRAHTAQARAAISQVPATAWWQRGLGAAAAACHVAHGCCAAQAAGPTGRAQAGSVDPPCPGGLCVMPVCLFSVDITATSGRVQHLCLRLYLCTSSPHACCPCVPCFKTYVAGWVPKKCSPCVLYHAAVLSPSPPVYCCQPSQLL